MGLKTFILDCWSWLNYKPVFHSAGGAPNRRAYPQAYSRWVPATDVRRLAAYTTMEAYHAAQAGPLAAIQTGTDDDRREYGDAAMLNEAIQAHILGRDQTIVVDGADNANTPKGDAGGQEHAQAVQDRLRAWAQDEQFAMRLQQAEHKAVVQGDGVYYLGWDPERERPRLQVTDPGFYFPEIGEDPSTDYPYRVHLAWDLPADPKRGLKDRMRRISWELAPIGVLHTTQYGDDGRLARLPVVGDDGTYTLTPGDTLDADGRWIQRQYPWNDKASRWTCYLTDATWLLEDLTGDMDVHNLPLSRADIAVRADGELLDRLDLMIDFVPVVHVPNTVPDAEEHWGRPALARVLQLLDDLAGTDTDSAHASATTGMPVIAASGLMTRRNNLQVKAGLVLELETGGRLDVLDTAGQLAELRRASQDLLDRLSANLRMPAVALGTADQSQLPSGYALALSMSPLDMMVATGRLARIHKYRLLLKMVQRLFMAGQHPNWTGPVVPAHLEFGPYTPTDVSAVLTDIATAYQAHLISLETALRLLTEAGWTIDDIDAEIERIQSRAFDQAGALADATGDQQAVRDFLNLKGAPPEQPPAVVLPQQVPQPPQPGRTPAEPGTAPGKGSAG
ncbi:hypothetical protein OG618_37220 (plasmid) [Kitasatospora sp. NBC_01246]|uniref:hypothetical protein n=1 Tax=Kitasatospora sp. NBC_01246 TaxID=2903570 RepID=UPI002E36C59E|nr:hypothetical protein [Kitasatospora sp. NBC_01246]